MNVASSLSESAGRRILYIITKANWGGAQRYVYDLALASKEKGYEVIVAYGTKGELEERLREAGIPTVPIHSLARSIKLRAELSAFLELLQLLRTLKPDIVHINSSKAGVLGVLAARIIGIRKIIFTAHGWAFNEFRPVWQKYVLKLVYAFTSMLSSYTICVSHKVRKDIQSWCVLGSSKKLIVIHNGIRASSYTTRAEARAHLWPEHADGIWLGMLSELHPTKRIEDTLEAVKILIRSYPDIKLIVLGEGEQRSYLEEKIKKLELEEVVRLAGFIKEAPKYLTAFNIFIHTSRSEALGYAIIEAGFAGLPVVATRVGGIPEIIKNGVTGELVAPLVPKELAKSVERYLKNPEAAEKIGLHLQKDVQERFSLEKMIYETMHVYTKD